MSKKPRHIFTPSQIDEMYDDWLHSIEDEVDIAHRYGFLHATTMRKFLEANGKPTVGVKQVTCPICGEKFIPSKANRVYCSTECQRYARNAQCKENNDKYRAEQQAEREKRIKERFIGYSKITAICIAAKAEGLSYGQYVGKYNL
jgi:hypothetical protein